MTTTNNLKLGIEAARANKADEARNYLTLALEQDPNNIAALFWMAYVAPSAEESLHLLDKILVLDPDNQRAKSGIRWAEKKLEAESSPPQKTEMTPTSPTNEDDTKPTPVQNNEIVSETTHESEPESTPETVIDNSAESNPEDVKDDSAENAIELPDAFIREQLLSNEDNQKRAKKGALAHRARRTIDPFLLVIIILGLTILLLAGVLALNLTPTQTLAAWLPLTTPNEVTSPETIAIETSSEAALSTEKIEASNQQDVPVVYQTTSDTLSVYTAATLAEGIKNSPNVSTAPPVPVPSTVSVTQPEALLSRPKPEVAQNLTEEAPILPEISENAIQKALTELSPHENPAISASINELIGPAGLILNGRRLFEPVDEILLPHKPATSTEKWIEVDVTLQQITAWEGNIPVMSFIGSTGLPNTPTVLGEYNIYWKLKSTLMAGADYYLPDVPYTMYFYGGYALHGTYWHDNFGQPMSHGCVNLNNDNAQQLFEWADPIMPSGQTQVVATYQSPGTLVVVHQ